MVWLFRKQPEKRLTKTMLVHGYVPHGDTLVYERFWLLIEYDDGSRAIEADYGAVLEFRHGIDLSVYSRVKAWQMGGKIAKNLIIDLNSFDREVEKAVQL